MITEISIIKFLKNCNEFLRPLIKILKYLGFSKNAIAWFKFYLSERKFKISINTSYSSLSNLLSGISQGSILGPFLSGISQGSILGPFFKPEYNFF